MFFEVPKSVRDLEGAVNDVEALNLVLQKHWDFDAKEIKKLTNDKATKVNIVNALKELTKKATADDNIFIYYSGHGSSSYDALGVMPKFYSSSGALLPYEFKSSGDTAEQMLNKLIIGKRDLKPIFIELDKTKAHTFIVFDTCFSGNTVRGKVGKYKSEANQLATRSQPITKPSKSGGNKLATRSHQIAEIGNYDEGDDEDIVNTLPQTKKEAYPYQNITYLAAASPKEPARDISKADLFKFPTFDNKAHGVFTDVLLRGLSGELQTDQNSDGKTIYNELLSSIKGFMVGKGHKQIPQILPPTSAEDINALRYQSILGQRNSLGGNASGHNIKRPEPILTVYVQDSNDKAKLISSIKQLSQIKLSSQRAELNLEKVGVDYVLTNLSGDVISTLKSPTYAKVLGRIEQEAWKKQFKQKLQQHAAINLELSINDGSTGDMLTEGDKLAFLVRSEKPLYLLLLNAESEGAIALLYPYERQELARIPAYQVKYIPSKNKQNWIKVQPPFGQGCSMLNSLVA